MAEVDQSQFSLMSLEEELTCSICLSTFDCPVTIPCGHNFCQECLLATWKDTYNCPQCLTVFATKPELKKNTVLSSVVQTFNLTSSKSEADLVGEEKEEEKEEKEGKEEKEDVTVRCDTCMEAAACQTCLTCMASFCEEHLRPHRENPTFRVHQLSEPVCDLLERICPDHHKLMEFFCSQHGRAICSICLQQTHKGCSFLSPEDQRNLKESDLREKLGLLDQKIERTDTVMFQVKDAQSRLKDAAAKRKTAFAAMYQQMRDILTQEELMAQHEVDHELEASQTKLRDFMTRLTGNTEKMQKAREGINRLLSQSQSLAFLQTSFDLPKVVKFDPYTPRVSLDSKKVTAAQAFAAVLKEHLTELVTQPFEDRILKLKPDENAVPLSGGNGSQPESDPPEQKEQYAPGKPGGPPMQPFFQPVPVPVFIGTHRDWNSSQYTLGQAPGSSKGAPSKGGQKKDKDKKPHGAPEGKKPHGAPGGKKPHGAPEGNKKHGKGSDFSKDNPKSHPSSGKPKEHQPQPKKK